MHPSRWFYRGSVSFMLLSVVLSCWATPVQATTASAAQPCQTPIKHPILATVAAANLINPSATDPNVFKSDLQQLVDQFTAGGGQAAAFIKDGSSGISAEANADTPFTSGSTYKVFVMWKAMVEISAGRLSENDSIPYLDYGDDDSGQSLPKLGVLDDQPVVIGSIGVGDALQQMIWYSDNSAAWSLAFYLGWGTIDDMLTAHNYSVTRLNQDDPQTSAREFARFFEELYNHSLDSDLNTVAYNRMMDLLKGQQLNTYLSPGFPDGTVFAHKPGFIYDYVNDGGVAFTPDGRPIYISVFTEGGGGTDLMQQIAKLAWNDLVIDPPAQKFAQTGQTLSGKFLSYWEANGGLTTFGLPITPARNEVSATDGKTYLTQWFERNRFELHPENAGTPYEVELGLLGKELCQNSLTQPAFATAKSQVDPANPNASTFFPQTGHNLANGFKAYWEANGGLTRFGYPISEEHAEVDPETGKTFIMQWFERARFEYHPENAGTPYTVLLGLLGKQILQTGK